MHTFFHDEMVQPLLGVKVLVARSKIGRFSDEERASFVAPSLRDIDARCMFRYALFARSLTMPQLEKLSSLMIDILLSTNNPADPTKNEMISLPISVSSMRRCLTNGTHSINENIPIPTISSIPQHCVILPSRWLTLFFNAGVKIDFSLYDFLLNNNHVAVKKDGFGLFGSKRFEMFVRMCNFDATNVFIPIPVFVWSDDFDLNNTVQNRASVWALTTTFIFPGQNGKVIEESFLSCLGTKGANHDEAKQMVLMDICTLNKHTSNIFSSSSQLKTSVPVKCYLHTILGDSPEKRSFISYSASSGLFACWFGYSAILNKMTTFPSCDKCFIYRRNRLCSDIKVESNSCSTCADWTMDFNDRLLLFEAPTGYPSQHSDVILNHNKHYLKPFKVTFKLMMNAASHGFDMYANGMWTKKNLEVYLSSYCMNGDSIKLLCTNAVRMKRVHSLRVKSGQTAKDELKVLLELKSVRLYNLPYAACCAWDYIILAYINVISFVSYSCCCHILVVGKNAELSSSI